MSVERATDHAGERAVEHIRLTGACPECDGPVETARADADHLHHVCGDCREEWVERDRAGRSPT